MSNTERYGLYHAHNEGFCSWYDFTKCFYGEAGLSTIINPISTAELNSDAKRPLDTRMSCARLDDTGFERLPHYEDAVKRYLKELKVTDHK